MYRLVKFSRIKVSQHQKISFSISNKGCSFCGIRDSTLFHNLKEGSLKANTLLRRHHTTDTDTIFSKNNEITKRKRFKNNKRYFTELLEVYGNTSSETRASVRKLKPGDVSRIATCPNIELDHFHKINNTKKLHTSDQTRANEIKQNSDESSIKNLPHQVVRNCVKENIECLDSSKPPLTEISGLCLTEKKNISCETKLDEYEMKNLLKTPNELFDQNKGIVLEELEEELHEDLDPFHDNVNADNLSALPLEQENAEEDDLHNDSVKSAFDHDDLLEGPYLKKTVKRKGGNWHKATKENLAKEKISDLEKKGKERAFNTTLYTYLQLCVSCNYLQRGLAALHHYKYRSKMSTKNPKITDIRIFEVLMRGFTTKGNYHKVNEIWKMALAVGLEPSLNMFALRLECAARSQQVEHQVAEVIRSLQEKGYQLNDIFVKCTFLGNQREVILKAIQEVHPEFEPVVPPPSLCYSCSLLQEVNDKKGSNTNLRSPAEGLFSKDQMTKFAEDQLNNEFSFQMKVKSIEKRLDSEENTKVYREKLETMRKSWINSLRQGFERDVAVLDLGKRCRYSISVLPYLKVLHRDSYVQIMMNEIKNLAEGSETFSPSTYMLYLNIGEQVRNRYIYKYKRTHGIIDKTKMIYDKYLDWYLDPSNNNGRSCNGRQEWQQLIHEHQNGPTIGAVEDEDWPSTVVLGIGKFLYNIIVGDAKIDVNILNKTNKQHMLPAFYRVYRQQGVKSVEEIKPHPVISKLFRAAAEEHILFNITLVPMLSPPVPWLNWQFGGYLTAKANIIRLPNQAIQQRQRLKEAPPQQLYPPLDSLNQLSSVPWRVNTPILDTVIEVFNTGGSAKLEIPEPPQFCPVAESVTASMSKQEKFEAYRQRLALRRQKSEMYSLWCDALYKLSLANHFRDKIFWLPHNMDFRGRVYPVPPHLSHLGGDMTRSLLSFAKGKPLGPDGLDWLKIHLVNLLGTKKRESIRERLAYANTIMPEILDSAEKPLTGCKWWMDSESPWQTLACCKEIAVALSHPEGPEHFVSHFPIHQDGSCNGLQHYAALGRDEAGACSVNLMPQDLPQDVYSCVAALVERERAKDAAAGVLVAKELDGFVRRKVIKQTVMTTVYGVTRFGARLQIAKQLKDIDSFPKEYVWPASTYLVAKTFESLREMFNSTREIQDWFTECARLVSQVCGQTMEYVTPLGLPVVQYYTRHRNVSLSTIRSDHLPEHFPIDMFERPNVMKQKNAFPPNFIHSLDSSHMMLTSILSEQSGITFVSVHDCYWTHASTVHIMNQICREQFVALHSQPILEDLSQFMLKRYGYDKSERSQPNSSASQVKQQLHDVLSQVPPKGTFILENVLDSIYFFS